MGEWLPVVYRGDEAWIGIMPDGRIGVGVELEGRATLEDSRFVPLWPLLERHFSKCLDELSQEWDTLGKGGVSTPEKLMESTVESAWNSGRPYWMRLAALWVIEMTHSENFDPGFVREILNEMRRSEIVESEVRNRMQQTTSIFPPADGE
ncbi:hypothetical protein SAMN05428945_6777 [Streptomyces sp. 2224.1]|uniref:hypothetical protein n=1 Tax=Streptomyces sp. 2224.1 TaxID=1881020 RepID=UPI0008966877|nr:hypothetical protein [Streptomyces sp. 2224.1]SEE20871.1 hypothetical protein SAMN05428945_6777 [Streptomyces sp. 2224.1]